MDDLHIWSKEISFSRTIAIVFEAIVKTMIFGIFYFFKSLIYTFIPDANKDIQNKVALVSNIHSYFTDFY